MPESPPYPPIRDYALIADSNSVALVSRAGSIDWCCIQRIDAGSCFGRLLDWQEGGFCSISPAAGSGDVSRRYLDETLVLETTFRVGGGVARLYDFYALPASTEEHPYRQLIRIVEGVSGSVELDLEIMPRFDYGSMKPWIRQEGVRVYSAIGGNDGLLISSDADIAQTDEHALRAAATVRAGERVRLSFTSVPPEQLDYDRPEALGANEMDRRLEETIAWWRDWSSAIRFEGQRKSSVLRSAITVKALMNDLTGAIAAAATTSLPENPGGSLNWDYRYSWIRDSFFSVRSLAEVGFDPVADRFRRFVERSSAGSADQLQLMYGMGGERRLTEETLDYLEGYRGARPVRVGNAAAGQLQLDMYGELLELSWRWHQRGNSPDDDYWRFLMELVDTAAERWPEPDSGIWEKRGDQRHFVHSKVMCWATLDKGLRLAKECMRKAPERRWKKTRGEIRDAIESEGYDKQRGVFVQSFGAKDLDAALLLLPRVGFVDYKDERMVRTTDAIRDELDDDGLLKRYRIDDGEQEGAFLACSFWLVECLAHQGRVEDARAVFDRTLATGNDLGLFAEEYDTVNGELLGNFPQGLTHLSHIAAAVALQKHESTV
ncbi:MAG TPA: glycoside hydrolase family 15 protein [Rubrobacteraceae bacterium]|nr:glycoside hydrolase family 15 protein [Rubrobacteraceae bacterium]